MIIYIINWFSILSFFGMVLILFREDKNIILNDIRKGHTKNIYVAVLHWLILFFIMPFSIPFSLYRIFKRWFY